MPRERGSSCEYKTTEKREAQRGKRWTNVITAPTQRQGDGGEDTGAKRLCGSPICEIWGKSLPSPLANSLDCSNHMNL